jgi:hypothetical protein
VGALVIDVIGLDPDAKALEVARGKDGAHPRDGDADDADQAVIAVLGPAFVAYAEQTQYQGLRSGVFAEERRRVQGAR